MLGGFFSTAPGALSALHFCKLLRQEVGSTFIAIANLLVPALAYTDEKVAVRTPLSGCVWRKPALLANRFQLALCVEKHLANPIWRDPLKLELEGCDIYTSDSAFFARGIEPHFFKNQLKIP